MATRRTTGSARTAEAASPAEKTATSRRNSALKAGATGASTAVTVSADTRRAMIAQAAYLRAERRGFTSGGEVEDWLAAEAEVDALLRAGNGRLPQ
jgi:hypothetical protein